MIKCIGNAFVKGGATVDKSRILPEYFPIIWKKSGFSMGLYIKGKGAFSIQISRESASVFSNNSNPITSLYALVVDLVGKKLVFRDAGNNNVVSKPISTNLVLSENKPNAYWFEMRCSKIMKGNNLHHNCFLCFGKSGDIDPLIEINIGNPFKELHKHPTFLSFVPVSNDTSIKVSFGCLKEFGEICAHTDECKKTDNNLICGNISRYRNSKRMNGVRTFEEDQCICRESHMRWVSEMKKCVIT